MAFMYIEEFAEMGIVQRNEYPIAKQPPLARQQIAIAAGSTASAAFNSKTRFVRLHVDAICSYRFGEAPTAVATDSRLAANQTEYFAVEPGGNWKVANITNT